MKTTDNQGELFVVVDREDNILGYKTRAECHSDKNLIHRSVGVIVFNDKGKVLLQKRSLTKDTFPGFYTISSSGHVNKDETYEQAAIRETREEIGVDVKVEPVTKFLYYGPNETEIDSLFKTTHNGPFKIKEDEVESVKFVTKEELKEMIDKLSPNAKEHLKRVNLL